jgi:2-phosphosulfolactate phosphatase
MCDWTGVPSALMPHEQTCQSLLIEFLHVGVYSGRLEATKEVPSLLRLCLLPAKWLAPSLERGRSVAVIAAGERWAYDDSLRPALEAHLGAGAILWCSSGLGYRDKMSPEAIAAVGLFDVSREHIVARLRDRVGGKELTIKSFVADVEAAADLNASTVVPILVDGSFGPAA